MFYIYAKTLFCFVVLKTQQTPQQGQMVQPPQSLLQMPNWNNMPGASNGNVPMPIGNVSMMPSATVGVNSSIASQIEAINAQQMTLQEQIRQSEQNLSAQHNVRTHTYIIFLLLLLLLLFIHEMYFFVHLPFYQLGVDATTAEAN